MQVLTPQVTEIPPAVRAWTRLLRAHASTTRLLNAELQAEHGLSLNDYEALYVLAHTEGQRLKRVELSRRLLLTPSGVTRLLEGLERAGLVERVSCPTDLRVAYAQLTDAGSEKLKVASGGHVDPPPVEFDGVPMIHKPYTIDRITPAIEEALASRLLSRSGTG